MTADQRLAFIHQRPVYAAALVAPEQPDPDLAAFGDQVRRISAAYMPADSLQSYIAKDLHAVRPPPDLVQTVAKTVCDGKDPWSGFYWIGEPSNLPPLVERHTIEFISRRMLRPVIPIASE
jgi:hypothetical protein